MKSIVAVALLLASTSTFAQTPSGSGKGKTCSGLVAECVAYNKKRGDDTSRCAGYKASCMATGTYMDRNRTITDVTRR
jgi:hypothetical protein